LLAVSGPGAWGSVSLQPFNLGIVNLDTSTDIDLMLLAAIGFENVAGGMGTAAFVALLMSLCNHRYTATHYALLSAFAAAGRIYVGPVSGVLAEAIGWPRFFVFSAGAAVPGLLVVWWLRSELRRLTTSEANPNPR
jgi:PAT family beta-lactamase induction signal transducer AmpG